MIKAFTLIELLVVITIIVVLLALLTPALDKAIYQAELAVCAANMRSIGTGVTTYANEFRRQYPYREIVRDSGEGRPSLIVVGTPEFRDDRAPIRGYVSLDLLLDPLSGKVDLEQTLDSSWVYATRQLWYGWQYRSENFGTTGMLKLGDRMRIPEPNADGTALTDQRFGYLAADWETQSIEEGFVYGAHPDADGVLGFVEYQDAGFPAPGLLDAGITQVLTFWTRDGGIDRGTLDRNFLASDLSVERLTNLVWGYNDARGMGDDRIVNIPESVEDNSDWKTSLPR